MGGQNKLRFSFNSPVVLIFTFACFIVMVLNLVTGNLAGDLVFSVYRSSLSNPLTYLRFFTHVLGHADWNHLFGNMTCFLLVGPLLEEKYGSKRILVVILVTALVTGLVSFVFFPHVALLGASGVVFAFILLSSITGFDEKKIPLTFVLVAVIYLGQEIYSGIFVNDNISNTAHLVGGAVGSVFGFFVFGKKTR